MCSSVSLLVERLHYDHLLIQSHLFPRKLLLNWLDFSWEVSALVTLSVNGEFKNSEFHSS